MKSISVKEFNESLKLRILFNLPIYIHIEVHNTCYLILRPHDKYFTNVNYKKPIFMPFKYKNKQIILKDI